MTTPKPTTHQAPTNLRDAQSLLTTHWRPQHILTANNTHSFKIATISNSFIWHAHPNTDEVFYVISGGPLMMDIATDLTSKHEDQGFETVRINVGDLFNVPLGYRHRPWVEQETGILMVEKVGTVNTGDEEGSPEGKERTVIVRKGDGEVA
ncbi:uncharacterized protein AB675_5804 [Cyphellophora attinorum]|uniref:Cupin type-1 domain-containing protein n=1 Tax=Cyphellophora attinorum TaxID=1664694 RepID=A0A0N1P0A7_9EURO|nr:uncharacterized protein AB675_5804 [Phialophora attinorum]KPI38752.1 hypothetical protein AB675_5804 [Phialophora attinorum]